MRWGCGARDRAPRPGARRAHRQSRGGSGPMRRPSRLMAGRWGRGGWRACGALGARARYGAGLSCARGALIEPGSARSPWVVGEWTTSSHVSRQGQAGWVKRSGAWRARKRGLGQDGTRIQGHLGPNVWRLGEPESRRACRHSTGRSRASFPSETGQRRCSRAPMMRLSRSGASSRAPSGILPSRLRTG